MIKKILVALDTDSDTPVATQHAVEMARRCDAEVTGIAVIDLEQISAGARGGGIGSMYYAEKLRENLTTETRHKAEELIQQFEAAMEGSGVRYTNRMREGVPFERILEDMKYHDLLVVGRDPHFFYSRPKQTTDTLAQVVKETIAPVFIVEPTYRPIRRVLIAYDGSMASARTMQRFAQMKPFGTDLAVEVLHVYQDQENEAESDLLLNLAGAYLESHGFQPELTGLRNDNPDHVIVEHARQHNVDLVVAGAHSVSRIRQLAFGSTTVSLLSKTPSTLFVHH